MGCCIQSSLAKILAEFEIAVERDILQPLNKLSEVALASPCSAVPSPNLCRSLRPLSPRRSCPSS